MRDEFILTFISQTDFESHVLGTLQEYKSVLSAVDLNKFNENIIDPIKLLFDKSVFRKSFNEIIELEIHRQRDKSNNNSIGYFHQKIFGYFKNCEVPKEGWDVIFKEKNFTYYVELKNKHNTMNSSSSAKTFMRMQNHLLNAADKERSICALVEVIAKRSQNIAWNITVDKQKQSENERLRRISIDKFYEIVTGEREAFKNLCLQLPKTIEKLTAKDNSLLVENDTVFDELTARNNEILTALYKLAFSSYEGF